MTPQAKHRTAFLALALSVAIALPHAVHAQAMKDLKGALRNTGKGIKATGEFIVEGAEKTGEAIGKGVEATGEAIEGDGSGKAAKAAAGDKPSDSEMAADRVPTPQQKPVPKTYLFVQQAGSLTYAEGKLTLADVAPSTLYFTDRPERQAGSMTNQAFAALWSETSGNGFDADPPNAAIAIVGQEPADRVVVELLTAELNGKDLIFSVKPVTGMIPPDAHDVALFIDLD